MLRNFFLHVLFPVIFVSLVGCGGSGTAQYDPSDVPPVTEEEKKSNADYEAQMEREMKEQYGN